MFGPDYCGPLFKIHFIFNYKGKNLEWKKKPPAQKDKLTHIYRMVLNPDNTYEVWSDDKKIESGNLEDDWEFLPPRQIKDPDASKPEDWVEIAEIDDPEDFKPDFWDKVPEKIADPEARKPTDWDDDEDGDWVAPMINNPKFKGEWKPKRIKNPAFKGPWEHPMIDNTDYEEDKKLYLYKDIGGIGLELWQVKSGTIFDNFWVGDSIEEADEFKKKWFDVMVEQEKQMFGWQQGEQDDDQRQRVRLNFNI